MPDLHLHRPPAANMRVLLGHVQLRQEANVNYGLLIYDQLDDEPSEGSTEPR